MKTPALGSSSPRRLLILTNTDLFVNEILSIFRRLFLWDIDLEEIVFIRVGVIGQY